MTTRLEEWLERMQTFRSDHAGAAVSVQVTRNNRDTGWMFQLNAETNLAELVDHIDSSCRDSGFAGPYELRAFDAEGRLCGPFKYTAQVAEIVPSSHMMPGLVEAAMEKGLQTQTAFTGLALKGMAQSQRYTMAMMDRLEKENARLAKENDALRNRLAEHWDTIEKLNTHELETKEQSERVRRMGNLAETAVTALMSRFTGQGSTASQVIDMRLFQSLFRSLASEPERLNKILELLGEDERIAVMELAKRAEQPEAPTLPDTMKTNGLAAASAAAATNGKGN